MNAQAAPEIKMPRNIEAEQALLAAILVNNRAYEKVASKLQPEHFSESAHGRIFAAIGKLIERGQRADPITLKNLFDQDEALEQIGGAQYLATLARNVVTIINAEDYGRTIHDCWTRRQVIEASLDAIADAQTHDLDTTGEQVREALETRLLGLQDAASTGSQGPRNLGEFATLALNTAENAYKRQGKLTGIPSGLLDLDRLTGGFQPSDLIYIAGRPSMGKSALAGTVALNAALLGHPVFLATPEMSGEQVALRTISIGTKISAQRIRTGDLKPDDFTVMMEDVQRLQRIPVKIDDLGGISLALLRARVRRFMLESPRLPGVATIDGKPALPLVLIDYIQLMSPAGKRRDQNRNDDVSELSRGLKALAKEFGIPVVALSQLSRAVESRDNKRPMLSDLRDSGSLEQDADVVAFIYREEYYASRSEPSRYANESDEKWTSRFEDWQRRLDEVRNLAEINLAKQRHGPTGKAILRFDPETTSFENLTRRDADIGPRYSAIGD
jgi:replicative DNA helicase